MKKSLIYTFLIVLFIKSQSFNAQSIDNHFFFLNNSLVDSDPVTYAPGSVLLSGVDYNEGSNTGYPSYLGNFYSNNISMNPFCTTARKAVYNFRQKTGLKYNNGAGSNFDDYTITVIIKFNTTPSRYFRVIDFSEGNSDNGIYNFQNNLNFFPNGNVRANAFSPNNFTFLTLTRDGSTNTIDVYINDTRVSTYTDSAGSYKFPASGNIIFARDNIPPSTAPNEDTNGQIAYIHVTNTKSTTAEVKNVYDNICSLIPPAVSAVNDVAPDADGKNGIIGVLNIFDNDTVDSNAITSSDITLTETTPDPTGNLTLNPDGTVDLAPNTPVGDYSLTYKICDLTYPSICDNATVTVSVLPIPQILSTVDGFICSNGSGTLSATASAGTINWYNNPTGGTSLGTGNIFSTPVVSNTTIYYVDATENWRVTEVRVPITLVVQHTPLPVANATQTFCDIDNARISDILISGTDVRWYSSSNANSNSGLPLSPNDFLTNATYYATQILNNCESPTRLPINVVIYETVVALLPANIPALQVCDDIGDGDDTNGLTSFDLTSNESVLLNVKNASDFSFTYFTDAGYTNQIFTPATFTNTVPNGQTIYVRIANASGNSCYTDTSFSIQVYPLPVITSIVELTQCDDDTDGISLFNLTEANALISTNHTNETFTFYLNDAQAQTGLIVDQITTITAYPNPTPLNSAVYARVETNDGCFRTSRINLVVGATQIPASFQLDYFECDNYLVDNDNINGITTFNFSDAEQTIKNLFPASLRPQITISYYTNLPDALSELNAIPDSSNHRNDASAFTQNIYVRIDTDIVNACLGLGHHITLTVNPLPLANSLSDYVLCSDTDVATFDLNTKRPEVIGSQTQPILVSYHETLTEAKNNTNPITAAYNNTISNPQTIYVRSQFDDNNNGVADTGECFSTDIAFNLIVNHNPVLTPPAPIRICSEQVDTTFDLTIRDNQITNGDTSIVLTYYESQLDLDNNNPIPTPASYLNIVLDRDIFILATGANTCTTQITMSLKTILYANLNKTPTAIEECEVDNDGYDNFDLRRREAEILNGLSPSDFEFSYYENEADAIAGNPNNITDASYFINTTPVTQTVYARVLPVANECFIIVPVSLIVNPVPEIDLEEKYVICLSATDTSIPPHLTTSLPNPPIDTMLNNAVYTFQWYKGIDDSSGTILVGETASSYIPTEPGDFTVIATNINTGCTIPATTTVVGSYPPESITVALGSDAFSGNNILDVTVVGNGDYEYRLDYGPWQTDHRFENVRGGERTIYVRDLYNCNEISAMQIIIDYPKYFTPNSDGTNDTWNIRGIATQPDARINIYDRYGKLLKQLRPTNSGWDGTFNGQLMPTNGYWFTVEYTEPSNGIVKIFKAHFTLKR